MHELGILNVFLVFQKFSTHVEPKAFHEQKRFLPSQNELIFIIEEIRVCWLIKILFFWKLSFFQQNSWSTKKLKAILVDIASKLFSDRLRLWKTKYWVEQTNRYSYFVELNTFYYFWCNYLIDKAQIFMDFHWFDCKNYEWVQNHKMFGFLIVWVVG